MSHHAFVAFLRCEAQQAEERAKQLRTTAAAIEANETSKKRGVAQKKARKGSVAGPTRVHTPYTIFIKENYEVIKRSNDPNLASKDIISILARQWASMSDQEKQLWKERAQAHKESQGESGQALDDEILAAGLEEFEHGKDRKKRAKKTPTVINMSAV